MKKALWLAVVCLFVPYLAHAKADKYDESFFKAIEKDDPEEFQKRLEKGVNIEAPDQYGNTSLNYAACFGRIEMIKALLEKGANIKTKNDQGNTPLGYAAGNGFPDVVRLLLEKGATIETKNSLGNTPLYRAAAYGHADTTRLLIESGADIEATNAVGNTPLFAAVLDGRLDMIRILLEKGANTDITNNFGKTMLEAASEITSVQQSDVIQLLEKNNPTPTGQIDPAATIDQLMSMLQKKPGDKALRERIIALTAENQLPLPEEARGLFLQAMTMLKQVTSPEQTERPIELLRQASNIAPWFGNAYYRLALALELSGRYDDAIRQIGFYLLTNPPEQEARAARDHIYEIRATKEKASVANKQEENRRALLYVSGGASRVRISEGHPEWKSTVNEEGALYHRVPTEKPFYANVFRLPNGRYVALVTSNTVYGACLIDISDPKTSESKSSSGWNVIPKLFAWRSSEDPKKNLGCFGMEQLKVQIEPEKAKHYTLLGSVSNGIVVVANEQRRALIMLPVSLLYRGFALNASGTGIIQLAKQTLFFDPSVVQAARDPNANPLSLTPTKTVER